MLDDVKDLATGIINDAKEVITERFFSPMYFYFIIAWIIYNWTFVYSLLFVDSEEFEKLKLDYLLNFYPTNSLWDYACNIWYILLGPAVSTYIIIFYISQVSELFYEKFETYKSNKTVIKRRVEFIEIRNIKEDKKRIYDYNFDEEKINYELNQDFNNWFDEINEFVLISGISYSPSRVLFNTDYKNYIEHVNDFKEQEENTNANEE